MFKAEIGALSGRTAQIQGVWVRPELRGRGIGTSALAASCDYALRQAPTVSLYVNAYNAPARAMYERLGFVQLNTLQHNPLLKQGDRGRRGLKPDEVVGPLW